MRYLKAGVVIAGMALLLTMGGALLWNFAPRPNFLDLPTSAPASVAVHVPGSLGRERHMILLEATRQFKERGVNVSQEIADGTELAPVTFLNGKLERQGAKWRVRSTNGQAADIYEIS